MRSFYIYSNRFLKIDSEAYVPSVFNFHTHTHIGRNVGCDKKCVSLHIRAHSRRFTRVKITIIQIAVKMSDIILSFNRPIVHFNHSSLNAHLSSLISQFLSFKVYRSSFIIHRSSFIVHHSSFIGNVERSKGCMYVLYLTFYKLYCF